MDSVLTHKTVKQIFVQPANLKQAVVANPEQAVVNKKHKPYGGKHPSCV